MNIPENFHIVDHALLKHKLSILRDINTRSKEFRELTREITSLLAYQATKELHTSMYEIQTPITAAKGYKVELDNILERVNKLIKRYKTIGNYYLIKNSSNNLRLFKND